MSASIQLKTHSNHIAQQIIRFVNNTGGPVTLAEIERHVIGIAQTTLPACSLWLPYSAGDVFVWGGLTDAAEAAFREIIYGRKVAIQFVTPEPYLDGQGCYVDRDWHPIMLLPAHGANISGVSFLARLSQQSLKDTIANSPPGKPAHVRLLTPGRLNFSADYFSIGDPRSRFYGLLIERSAA